MQQGACSSVKFHTRPHDASLIARKEHKENFSDYRPVFFNYIYVKECQFAKYC